MKADCEELQARHYDSIARDYADHYADKTSRKYREKFIYPRMFAQIDLRGKRVLDAMCGMGTTSEFVISQGAKATAIDISCEFIEIVKSTLPEVEALESSVFDLPFADETFDLVVVVGGLHHLHPKLDLGLREFWRVLKKDGMLICMEPPRGSIFDFLRQIWYRFDRYFEENEESVSVKEIVKTHQSLFTLVDTYYGNGPAYFLIYNSLITRIPLKIKEIISEPLLKFDRLVEWFVIPQIAAYVIFRMKKKQS